MLAQFLNSKNVLAQLLDHRYCASTKKTFPEKKNCARTFFEITKLCSHIFKIKKLCEHNFGKCLIWFFLSQKHVCQCSGGMVRELPSTQVGSVRAYINTIFCHFVMNFCSKYLFVFG